MKSALDGMMHASPASADRGDDRAVWIVLPGVPVAKGRPRFFNGRAVTPAATRSYENDLRAVARVSMRGRPVFDEPLRLAVLAVMAIPASWSARRKAAAVDGSIRPTGRPDLDNIVKCAKDALDGTVWRDDAIVVSEASDKIYGLEPRLVLMITPLAVSPSDRASEQPL